MLDQKYTCDWTSNDKLYNSSLTEQVLVAREALGVDVYRLKDLLTKLNELTGHDLPPMMNRTVFQENMVLIALTRGITSKPHHMSIVNLVFDVLDIDEDGYVSAFEFSAGLGLLCAGTFKQNFRTAFNVLNSKREFNHDSKVKITLSECYSAYCIVFRLLYQLYDDILARVGCDPDNFARSLTTRAFTTHGGKHEHQRKYVTLSIFVQHFLFGLEQIISDAPMLIETHYGSDFANNISNVHIIDFIDAKRVLGLTRFSPNLIINYIIDLCDEDGTLTESTLHQGVAKLIRKHYESLPLLDRPVADHIIQRLFDLFRVRSTEKCTFTDISCALICFCGGSLPRKAKAVFQLYCTTSKHREEQCISQEGIRSCLRTIFTIISDLDPVTHFNSKEHCDSMAKKLSEEVFIQNPEHRLDRSLVLEEFSVIFERVILSFESAFVASVPEEKDAESDAASNSSEEYVDSLNRRRQRSGETVWTGCRGADGARCTSSSCFTMAVDTDEAASQEPASEAESEDDPATAPEDVYRAHEHIHSSLDDEEDDAEQVQRELRHASEVLQVNGFSPKELVDTVKEHASVGSVHSAVPAGFITLPSWLLLISYFCKLNGASGRDVAAAGQLGEHLFAALDAQQSNLVPVSHLCAALAMPLSCRMPSTRSSSKQSSSWVRSKVTAVFSMFDTDGDGFISSSLLERMLSCVLASLAVCSPTAALKIRRSGVDTDCLANVLIHKALKAEHLQSSAADEITLQQLQDFAAHVLRQHS